MEEQRSEAFSEMMAQFAKQVRNIPYEADSITIFHDMEPGERLEAYIAGVLVGMMTALREQLLTERSMDKFEHYVVSCVPMARKVAEEWKKMSTPR